VFFFDFGYKIQKHFVGVGALSFILLTVCIVVSLQRKKLVIKTDIEDIWIACKSLFICVYLLYINDKKFGRYKIWDKIDAQSFLAQIWKSAQIF